MMKVLTKLLFALLLVSLAAGCKKGSDEAKTEYYLKFKLDGNWVTWSDGMAELGPDLDDATKTNFGFNVSGPDSKQSLSVAFQVEGSSIATGSYNSNDYFMGFDYITGSGSNTVFYGLQNHDEPYSLYTITLNEITQTTVKGSFTGNFLADDFSEGNTVAITEGEFFLKRIR